jgi:hypothetical protein
MANKWEREHFEVLAADPPPLSREDYERYVLGRPGSRTLGEVERDIEDWRNSR